MNEFVNNRFIADVCRDLKGNALNAIDQLWLAEIDQEASLQTCGFQVRQQLCLGDFG